ncbi:MULTISPECIES: mannose-1-phosphate guanylyltransferase/mannose-6-phosphate isomerase [unclassified Ruegeria]|uniref:mannose-1-phosphate guanylyltransferase/mannose-6-phosphate isomerase n=1 Tax=unclassified Ruegeria TaxID=2625375 RepID=UPI001489CA1A|nr:MULTISPECIES: mannose-1-phosphate guanylyltransferase/mannose-6-phosphate isomerase [unclassified Ruegeria]NOD64570.1 mannose-1-phosphate guanylyltransferase/mannose-6-phosphate isomerase [Ruegeria sp. HKCCD6109]
MTNTIHPVILCGGSGTRLWPLSRKSYPKQFVPLVGEATLLQDCADRMLGPSDMPYAKPLVLTNEAFRFIVPEQLAEVGIDPGPILIEPEGRNTAPAVLAAALYLASRNPDAIMLVAPSDHVIPNKSAFHAAVAEGARAIRERGDLVTFGITPTRPETGYGYLKLNHAPDSTEGAVPLDRFVEKPDEETAQSMLADGSYLWNSGIFLFAVRDIVAAFEQHAGSLIAPVQKAVNEAKTDLGFLRLDPTAWADAADISIDYAIMEKAPNLSVVPYSAGWSDVGSWTAVQELSDLSEDGVATDGEVTAIECRNVLIRSESPTQEVVAMGLENVIAVAMPDAVLVASMDKAQDVKQAVTALREKGAKQAEALPVDHRPWGWFESLVIGDRFQVKRIHVHPGAALSLQSHHHRSEHWIVVKGTAKVTIDDKEQLVCENQSVYIPLGAKHRMENPGKVPMVLIEVQTGAYLGEDDIIRYEDIYARE